MKRLDTATRSFVALGLVGLSLGAGIGLVLCCLVAFLGGHALQQGVVATVDDATLRPALILIALVFGGTVAALTSAIRQLVRTRQLGRWVGAHEQSLPPDLAAGASRVGLRRVQLVDAVEPTAFTVGLFAPVVVMSRGLLEQLGDDELDAVLEHERYHVRHRDPLRMFVAQLLTRTHFYLPALSMLRDRYLVGRELAADRGAVRSHGQAPLVRALMKAIQAPEIAVGGAIATLAGRDALEARIAQLETGHEPPLAKPAPSRVVLTLAGGTGFGWALVVSAVTFGGFPGLMGRLCGCS